MIRRPPRSTLFPYTTLFRSRGLDLGGRAAPAQHADVYVERAGSDLTGEHGRTGTQELSWVADFQAGRPQRQDRKSTRLNSSHLVISYAVFCLKKKNKHDALHVPVLMRDRIDRQNVLALRFVLAGIYCTAVGHHQCTALDDAVLSLRNSLAHAL